MLCFYWKEYFVWFLKPQVCTEILDLYNYMTTENDLMQFIAILCHKHWPSDLFPDYYYYLLEERKYKKTTIVYNLQPYGPFIHNLEKTKGKIVCAWIVIRKDGKRTCKDTVWSRYGAAVQITILRMNPQVSGPICCHLFCIKQDWNHPQWAAHSKGNNIREDFSFSFPKRDSCFQSQNTLKLRAKCERISC